ncbi:MAG: GNAT family N-acetyltransferase, partial [bacterium]
MRKNPEIKDLKESDLSDIAAIHVSSFHYSAFTAMGEKVVRRYYKWLLMGPHEVAAKGVFLNNKLAGFCFGGIFYGATSGFLRKNQLYLAFTVLFQPWLVFNSIIRTRILQGLCILKRYAKPKSQDQIKGKKIKKEYTILSIAVNPKSQTKGIGRMLMEDSEKIAVKGGFKKMKLTVSPQNINAVKFYEGLKWCKIANNDDKW